MTGGILWNRMQYVLSPQWDIYKIVAERVRDKVADIGFGTGFGSHLFTVNAKEVHGFEVDENAIRFAQKVFPFKKLFFQYGDIEKGIEENGFDFIVMIDVIEHLKYDKQAFINIKKMLSKRGMLILSTPNRLSRYRKAETHYREYAPRELEGIMKRIFVSVSLCNYQMEPLVSQYENPILAICKNEK